MAYQFHNKIKNVYGIRVPVPRSKNFGFTLLEVVIASGIFIISIFALTTFTQMQVSFQNDQKMKSGALGVKSNLVYTLMSPREWRNIISKSSATLNADLQCMKKVTTPCVIPATSYTLTLVDLDGTITYDPSSLTSGFTEAGGSCSTFDAASGNNQCPYRYEISWKPICNPDPVDATKCEINGQFPEVEVKGVFKVKFADAGRFKGRVDTFDFAMTPPPTHVDGPIAHSDIILTNQGSAVTFDLIANDVSDSGTDLKIKSLAAAGKGGSVLRLDDKRVTYTPPVGFFGMDYFKYTVEDELGNLNIATAYVKVMTPYTWTGEGADRNWSTVNNWCGVVDLAAQKCLHNQDMSDIPNMAMVFNENCTEQCEAHIDQTTMTVGSVLMTEGFMGKVIHENSATLNVGNDVAADVKNYFDDRTIADSWVILPTPWPILNCGPSFPNVFPAFDEICDASGWRSTPGTPRVIQKKGTFVIAGGEYVGQSGKLSIVGSLLVHNGVFTAPAGTMYIGSHFYQGNNAFKHGNGKVVIGKTLAGNRYNLKYDNSFAGGWFASLAKTDSEFRMNMKPVIIRGYDSNFFDLEIAADGPVLVGLTSQMDDNGARVWSFLNGGAPAPTFPWRRFDLDGVPPVAAVNFTYEPAETKINVLGTLTLKGTMYCGLRAGAILVFGDIVADGEGCASPYHATGKLSATQIIAGGGMNASIESIGTAGYIPNLIINKAAGATLTLKNTRVVGTYRCLSGAINQAATDTLTLAKGVDYLDIADSSRLNGFNMETAVYPTNFFVSAIWNGGIYVNFGDANSYGRVSFTNYFGSNPLKKTGRTEVIFLSDATVEHLDFDLDDTNVSIPSMFFSVPNSVSATGMTLASFRIGMNATINIRQSLRTTALVNSEDSNYQKAFPKVFFNFVGSSNTTADFVKPHSAFFNTYNPSLQGGLVRVNKTGGTLTFSGEPVLTNYEFNSGTVDFTSNNTTVHWVGITYPYDSVSTYWAPAWAGGLNGISKFKFPDANPINNNCFNNLVLEYNGGQGYRALAGPVCVKGNFISKNTLGLTGTNSGHGASGCLTGFSYCTLQLVSVADPNDTSELVLHRDFIVENDSTWMMLKRLRMVGGNGAEIRMNNARLGIGDDSSQAGFTSTIAGDGVIQIEKTGGAQVNVLGQINDVRAFRVLDGDLLLNGGNYTLHSANIFSFASGVYRNYDTLFGSAAFDFTTTYVSSTGRLFLQGGTLDSANTAIDPGGQIVLGGGTFLQAPTYSLPLPFLGTGTRRTLPSPLTGSELVP